MTATSSTTCMAYRKHQSSITSNSSTWSQCSIPDRDWSRHNSDGSSHSMVSTPTTIEPSTLKMVNRNVQCNTTRRKRSRSNSRRFVITELPLDPEWYHSDVCHDDDEEENDSTVNQSETASICSSDDVITSDCPSGTQALCHPRPNKTEVRGRFTIIDLSPEFPQTTSEDSTSPPEKGSSATVRRPVRALPRRCVAPTPIMTAPELHPPLQSPVFDNDSLLDMARNQLHQHTQHTQHLRAFDRHLEYLQQESSDMKALLESMVSSNSRWIEALAKSTSTQDNSIQRDTQRILQREEEQVSEKLKIGELSPPPCVQTSIDHQLAALQGAYHELDLKYETLVRQNTQIERSNIMLEARLRQEMTLNDELRAHVDQLTQYTESLILTVDTFPECDEKDVPDERLDEKLKLCHLAAECSTPKSRRRRRNSLVTVITMDDDSSDENIIPCPLTAPSSGGSSSNQTAPSSNTSVDQHEPTWSFCHFGSNQSLVGGDDVAENESVDNDDRHNDVSLQCDDIEDWTVADGREQMMVTTQESSNQMGEVSSIAKDRRSFFPSHFLPTTAKTHSEKPICLRRGPPSPEKSTLSLLASPNAVFRQIRLAPR